MKPLLPDFNQGKFDPENSTTISNPYFPLESGKIIAYEAQKDGEVVESNQLFTTFDTKEILGVKNFVVRDVAWDEGTLVEDTFDWYAQDTDGNVWYMGETATNYEYDDEGNFIGTNNDGSWEAGVDGAKAGFEMKANPQVGDNYYQEFFPGEAEDEAIVVGTNESITIGLGTFENVLKIRDFSQLEPDISEFKYYAPEVGQILADEGITKEGGTPEISPELVDTSELANAVLPALSITEFENSTDIDNSYFPLIPGTLSVYEGKEVDEDTREVELERREVLVTNDTLDILGITSRVVQEKEFENGLLSEEKLSYYAQDKEGNVWLLGEDETDYEYDTQGNLVNTDKSDSWIAGQDENLPGIIMDGTPENGEGYYQRFEVGEDEQELAKIIDTDASVSSKFVDFEDVIKVKEFSESDSDEFDYKYYAKGVGEVFTEEIDDGEVEFSSSLIKVEDVTEPPQSSLETIFGSIGADLIEVDGSNQLIFGGADADFIDASISSGGGNRIYAGGGDDTLILGSGDRLVGGAGADTIFVTNGGDNTITGGAGADQFWIAVASIPDSVNTITDFTIGEDVIGLVGLGIGFEDLSITQSGENALIGTGSQNLAIFLSTDANSLTADNFAITL
ncbi:MAG: hypothetical protein AAF378_15425 [Cyanobacteria bacterium P01_A01_bin.84]